MSKKLRKAVIVTLCLFIILSVSFVRKNFAESIVVSVLMSKSTYSYREPISIFGKVYYNGEEINGSLVAIQVYNSEKTFLYRTSVTGGNFTVKSEIEIVSIIPCDCQGSPKNAFTRDSKAYFNVTIRNYVPLSREVVVAVTVYDIDGSVLGANSNSAHLVSQGSLSCIVEMYIPPWSSIGQGLVFASVFSDYPKNGGYPYCPEKRGFFNIIEDSSAVPSTQFNEEYEDSFYNVTFRLPPYPEPYSETFNVTAVVHNYGLTDMHSVSFNYQYEVLGDFDLNHKIDIYDVVKVAWAYGSKPGDLAWDPILDIFPDGAINIYDMVKVTTNYSKIY